MARSDPRRLVTDLDAFLAWGDLCGLCTGDGLIWCPACFGFAGCHTCLKTFKVPCPDCAGGDLEPILSYR